MALLIANSCFGQQDTSLKAEKKIILGINLGSLLAITPKNLNNPNSERKGDALFFILLVLRLKKGNFFCSCSCC